MSSTKVEETLHVFCDFDGTIAVKDVGYHMLSHFSTVGNDDLIELWNTRRIGARECLLIEAKRVNATREEMIAYVDQFELDPLFAKFVRLARMRGAAPIALSDGLDFYIDHLLEKHNLGDLERYANKALFEGRTLRVEFPYGNGCGRCGSCKAERIRAISKRDNANGQVVFIGDGYSDICAIDETDILYAKSDLRRYCESENIPHRPFETFADVIDSLFGVSN
ncbi:MAG: MtnX-like HAD-IB family phosphatase [Candidatus Zixiibacteriota bacterium]